MVQFEQFKALVLVLHGSRYCSCLSAVWRAPRVYAAFRWSQMSFARTRMSLCVLGLCYVVAGPKRRPSVPGSGLASPRPPDPAGAVFRLVPYWEPFAPGLQIQVLSPIAGLAWLRNLCSGAWNLRLESPRIILCHAVSVRQKHHLRERTHPASSPRTSSLQALPFSLLDEKLLAPSPMEVMNVCSPQLAATFPASHLLKCVRKREALCHVWPVLRSEMSCSRNAHKTPDNRRESGLTKSSAVSKPVQDGRR